MVAIQVLTLLTVHWTNGSPDIKLEFKNGNQYDVRPDNLTTETKDTPPEWSEGVWHGGKKIYKANFMHVAWSVNYETSTFIEDLAGLHLFADGSPIQHKTEIEDCGYITRC